MHTPTAAVSMPGDPGPDYPAPHILVVDDATVVRLYYRQILEREGYRVEEAINGIEGMEKALETPFDLCVVDVNMPLMDGYAFLHALRREPITHSIPAMMTTTEAGASDRRAALDAGANAYLVKPVPREQFALFVAALLGRPLADPSLGGPCLNELPRQDLPRQDLPRQDLPRPGRSIA
jgi:two-component system chemotaxis response regulator CheY